MVRGFQIGLLYLDAGDSDSSRRASKPPRQVLICLVTIISVKDAGNGVTSEQLEIRTRENRIQICRACVSSRLVSRLNAGWDQVCACRIAAVEIFVEWDAELLDTGEEVVCV